MAPLALHLAGEHVLGDERLSFDRGEQVVLEAAREMENRFRRRVVLDEFRRTRPADLDAPEEVGLRAGHLEEACRLERRAALAEDLLVWLEAHLGATAIVDRAELVELSLGVAATEPHPVKLLAARDFDFEQLRERIHDRDADAVEAARGVVGLALELSARVQDRHDDFEGGLGLELGMRIDRDAAAVVRHRKEAVRIEADVDEGRMAGHRLVHGVVEHFGEEVVQRLLVRAADVHPRATADGLEPFQNLDVGRGIAFLGLPATAAFFEVGEEIT